MRKLLLSILLLTLCPLLFGALQVLPARIYYPSTALFAGGTTTGTMDDDVDVIGCGCMFPKTGTMTDVQITTSTITTADTAVPFEFQGMGADGNPSGTAYVANASGFLNLAAADDNVADEAQVNGGTGVTVTLGDMSVFVLRRTLTTGTLVGIFRFNLTTNTTASTGTTNIYDYNVTTPVTWTRNAGQPYLALKIDGVWMSCVGSFGGITGANTTDSYQSDDERGILVNTAVSARAVGIKFQGIIAAATTIKGSLYSDIAATPDLETATIALDTDSFTSAVGARAAEMFFTAPETLLANTDYMAALSPQGAVNIGLSYFPANATYATAFPTGSTGVMYTRANVGDAFTVVSPNRLPVIALIIDAIDTGSSAGAWVAGLNNGTLRDLVDNQWLRGGEVKYKRGMLWGK